MTAPDSERRSLGLEGGALCPLSGWRERAGHPEGGCERLRPAHRSGPWVSRLKNATLVALAPGAVLAAWWLLGRGGILNPYLTPPPGEVLAAARDALASGELWLHSCVSLARVFAGFALTVCCALPLAALLYCFPASERVLRVPLELLRITPPLALIPLLILWFGIG